MQEPCVLVREKRPLDLRAFRSRSAQESDFSTLLREPTILCDRETGRVRVVYVYLEEDSTDLVRAIRAVSFGATSERTRGMLSRSRIFGYHPRTKMRNDFCATASLARENPVVHQMVMSYAQRVARYYERFNPELFARHQQMVEKVLPEWTIDGSIFTSGIINKNNPLPYHLDAGNFKDVWSNMLVFKHQIAGGYLAVPEYDVGFEVRHNSLLMFDGQNILHGVTPIVLQEEHAWRFSLVYYSLQAMWKCLSPDQEIERIQQVRTEYEDRRAQREGST